MKQIIFRFPTTKKDKILGANYLEIAAMSMDMAEKWFKNPDGTYRDQGVRLIQQACGFWNMAANKFGFRNLADMEAYKERHGTNFMKVKV